MTGFLKYSFLQLQSQIDLMHFPKESSIDSARQSDSLSIHHLPTTTANQCVIRPSSTMHSHLRFPEINFSLGKDRLIQFVSKICGSTESQTQTSSRLQSNGEKVLGFDGRELDVVMQISAHCSKVKTPGRMNAFHCLKQSWLLAAGQSWSH